VSVTVPALTTASRRVSVRAPGTALSCVQFEPYRRTLSRPWTRFEADRATQDRGSSHTKGPLWRQVTRALCGPGEAGGSNPHVTTRACIKAAARWAGPGSTPLPAGFNGTQIHPVPQSTVLASARRRRQLAHYPLGALAGQQAAGTDRAWALGRGVSA
jgi:hypothetical protein